MYCSWIGKICIFVTVINSQDNKNRKKQRRPAKLIKSRLASFDINELRDLIEYNELELDTLGDQKTAPPFICGKMECPHHTNERWCQINNS